MEGNNFPYQKLPKHLINQIILFFPFNAFQSIISKYPPEEFQSILKQYYPFNIKNKSVVFKLIKELPNQMSYLSENMFLPIYNAGVNGVFEPTGNERLKNMNNPFYVNDSFFVPTVLNKELFIIGGMYYNVDVKDYYSFLKNFKLPFESIKEDYINTNMQKLSKILKKNNFDFTDFDYYRFYRDSTLFDERTVRKKKLKFINIKNEIVKFFKNNHYYFYGCEVEAEKSVYNIICKNELFEDFKPKLKFILKSVKFCMLCNQFTFHIYNINKDYFAYNEIDDLNKQCLQQEKKVIHTYTSDDGVSITEYYDNDEENIIRPLLSISTTNNVEYIDYELHRYRFGKFLFISYNKKKSTDRLPKIYFYGAMINS